MRVRCACCLAVFLLAHLSGCDGSDPNDASVRDGGPDGGSDGGLDAEAPIELVANAGADRYAIVGETVTLDGSASTGATRFHWRFGDGRESPVPGPDAAVHVIYDLPGRYRAFLTVSDGSDIERTDSVTIVVTHPLTHTPRRSSSVVDWPEREVVGVVSPDSDELTIVSYDATAAPSGARLVTRVPTCEQPRSVAVWRDRWVVACAQGEMLQMLTPEGAVELELSLPLGSRPFAVVGDETALFVTLNALGEIVRVEPSGGSFAIVDRFFAIEDARDVALLPDGRLAVSRWRSPDAEGQIALVARDGSASVLLPLMFDPQPASDTESGGVPSYLGALAISPTGRIGVMPSLQAAIGEGLLRSGQPMEHDTTLRAALSFVDLGTESELTSRRKLFDNRGFASAAVFSSHGDFAFVAMRGSRVVERFDVLSSTQAGSIIDAGFAPQGLALSSDDRLLFVDAYLSRELIVYDVSRPGALPMELVRINTVTSEPLSPAVLRGKVLFNDAADPRIGEDSYIACGHCHLDGLSDRRVWDFTDRGEGLRNTIDLIGRAGLGHGPLHWSANFDEVQDFEHDIRGPFGGSGLMDDADFLSGMRDEPLGGPKAGLSADLDALAAYVSSLDRSFVSPNRNPDGTLPPAAVRGELVFGTAGCPVCHIAPSFTDSGFEPGGAPRLHDVGTIVASSGMRLGGPLSGIDTPTLLSLWMSAPYLHDGSAPTLREVVTVRNATDQHGATSGLSPTEIDDLVSYLRCL